MAALGIVAKFPNGLSGAGFLFGVRGVFSALLSSSGMRMPLASRACSASNCSSLRKAQKFEDYARVLKDAFQHFKYGWQPELFECLRERGVVFPRAFVKTAKDSGVSVPATFRSRAYNLCRLRVHQ